MTLGIVWRSPGPMIRPGSKLRVVRARAIHAAKVSAVLVTAIAISLVLWLALLAIMLHDVLTIPPG